MLKTILFLILSFTFVLSADAAPSYGTRMPLAKKFYSGTETHAIFKRYLEKNMGKVRSLQHFWRISYGFYDWLCVDLKGGAGNIKQHPVSSDEIDYPSGFAGGYGFRLRLYENKKAKIVFGFQHISVHPKKVKLGSVKHQAILDDWQTSLLASYAFPRITPYLGTKWSRVDYIHSVEEQRKRVMSDPTNDIGLICGFDLSVSERCWINLEAQLFDTEAIAGSINFAF